MPTRERFTLTGALDAPVAGILDRPDAEPLGHALYAHCFTCSKDTIASARIASALVDAGIAVARIDFTGLGESGGDFADTTVSSDIEDLVLAAEHLRARGAAPDLLVGHSMGGAVAIEAAGHIPSVAAVATVAAPYDVAAVQRHFLRERAAIDGDGRADVMLAGRPMCITREFVADLNLHDTPRRAAELTVPLLLLHAPDDREVEFADAQRLFAAAPRGSGLLSLDGADHLLTRAGAAEHSGALIATWARPHLPGAGRSVTMKTTKIRPRTDPVPDGGTAAAPAPLEPGVVTVETNGNGAFGHTVRAGRHTWWADEPADVPGALDSGPSPYDHLLAALGTCTAMTLQMYANRKKLPLDSVSVRLRHERVHASDCAEAETQDGHIALIHREIAMVGELDTATRTRMLQIADRCPVHRTLESEIIVRTREAG